ncbi:MAG: hypothetical protein OQK09_05200 [Colwellia sp.]|nr:hypothetical protein [Colwellia sp.]MCW8866374.1 hypothetical protein [Colwellia sp.]MCW9080888.1 hypothetical protein [Colwellia sp.]
MKYNRELLFGRWFRHDVDEYNRKVVEYAQLSADGSFEFTFVTYEVKAGEIEQVVEQVTELGDWGLVADIHFTMTKNEVVDEQLYAADLNDSNNYHAYKVLQLNHQTFEYQHIETDEIYIMRKITDNIGHC